MNYRKAYFIGIGGIGMSALAQYLADEGIAVSGSDREASPVTELLESKGVKAIIGQKAENVPADADLVVYSEAVWKDNPERERAKELGVRQISYFEALGEATKGKRLIAVAGTHGKTTTSGMLAKVLRDAGARPHAIIGSLVKDFGSNYLKGDSLDGQADLFVVEACEYKRDFLSLSPAMLVITNIEWDHTDYYPSLAELQKAFRELAEKVPADGAIITNISHPNIAPVLEGLSARIVDYTKEPAYELQLPGEFNRMNARAAAAAARCALPDIEDAAITASLSQFQGTWRRFEYKGKTKGGADVYDDYAHHPTAIKATLTELKKKLGPPSPGSGEAKGKIYVAFHPHLYSRTRDLLPEFATAFADADETIIAPIYPAREPDDGITSNKLLAEKIAETGKRARFGTFEEIERILSTEPKAGDIIMTMGAGDIYKVADTLIER